MTLRLALLGLTGLLLAGGGAQAWDRGATSRAGRPFSHLADPQAGRVDVFRVATFNAEFLFDGEGNEGGADFPWKSDTAAARVHRQAVSRVIRTIDADVVVLVETENVAILRTMIARDLRGMGYQATLIEGQDTFTGQDVGVLSRMPVDTSFRTDDRAPIAGSTERYGVSKNLIIRFTMHEMPVSLVGLHLLAQPESEARRPRREAQAEVVRRAVVRETAAGRHVIVAGDFNDFDPSVPDARRSRPVTNVLAAIRAAGTGPRDDLSNVLTEVPRRSRYTVGRDWDGDGTLETHELSAVDHILLSPALRRRVVDVRVAHDSEARAASDHWPVVVSLSAN